MIENRFMHDNWDKQKHKGVTLQSKPSREDFEAGFTSSIVEQRISWAKITLKGYCPTDSQILRGLQDESAAVRSAWAARCDYTPDYRQIIIGLCDESSAVRSNMAHRTDVRPIDNHWLRAIDHHDVTVIKDFLCKQTPIAPAIQHKIFDKFIKSEPHIVMMLANRPHHALTAEQLNSIMKADTSEWAKISWAFTIVDGDQLKKQIMADIAARTFKQANQTESMKSRPRL